MSVLPKSAGTQIACRIDIGLQRRNVFDQKDFSLGQAEETNKFQQTFKAKQLQSDILNKIYRYPYWHKSHLFKLFSE